VSLLVDAHARKVSYLRLSLTERCNLACVYCVPHDHEALPADWMGDDEVVALVDALIPLGLRRVRLTGGEPTLRPALARARREAGGAGARGSFAQHQRHAARRAGRTAGGGGTAPAHISLDSLQATRIAYLSGGRGELATVLAGIDAAVSAGFSHTKLNIVALAGVNEDELPALARYAWERGITPRFIELMPMSDGAVAPADGCCRQRRSDASCKTPSARSSWRTRQRCPAWAGALCAGAGRCVARCALWPHRGGDRTLLRCLQPGPHLRPWATPHLPRHRRSSAA